MLSKYFLNKKIHLIKSPFQPFGVLKKRYCKTWTQCGKEIILAPNCLLVSGFPMFPNASQLTNLKEDGETSYAVLQKIFRECVNETPIRKHLLMQRQVIYWVELQLLHQSFVFTGMLRPGMQSCFKGLWNLPWVPGKLSSSWLILRNLEEIISLIVFIFLFLLFFPSQLVYRDDCYRVFYVPIKSKQKKPQKPQEKTNH